MTEQPAPRFETRPDGVVVCAWPSDGPPLRSEQDALDIVGNAGWHGAGIVAIPVGRLAPEMFDLRTRALGEFLQKLVNYRLPVAFVGDVTAYTAASRALADFV